MVDAKKDHNRVTPRGKLLGFQFVRLVEPLITDMLKAGIPDERCKTCAFRLGTVPNGCAQTMLDAVKAVMEQKRFLCHGPGNQTCHGWAMAVLARNSAPVDCPWDFSPADEG